MKEETTARLFDLSQSLEEKENALHATEEKANRAQHIADQWKLKFEKNELCLKSANDKLKSLEEYNVRIFSLFFLKRHRTLNLKMRTLLPRFRNSNVKPTH